MSNTRCNGGQTSHPCPAALATLTKEHMRMTSYTISCPVCGNSWQAGHWSLDRWPGDTGSAFDYRRMVSVAGVMQID